MNDFNKFGRTYQVMVQADAPFRAHAEDIGLLKARNNKGEMVPLSTLLHIRQSHGPDRAMRYNGFPTADVNGGAAPGFSTGQAQAAVERIAAETLPRGIGYEWTDLTYQEKIAGNTLTGGDNNIFTQIGLVVLVGLACKNAILIVEFARELEHRGRGVYEAAVEAARLRLRPILMTSIAFIAGTVPLVFSTGAGAEMRHAMGIAVFAGMIGVTSFGLFLTPIFYVILRSLVANPRHDSPADAQVEENSALDDFPGSELDSPEPSLVGRE